MSLPYFKYSTNNITQIINSNYVYCIYCMKKYDSCIEKWTDNKTTAICNYCSVDAIIPESVFEGKKEDEIKQQLKEWRMC